MSTIQYIAIPKNVKVLTGQIHGRWTVIGFSHTQKKSSWWLCRCECGAIKVVRGNNLTHGGSLSCGCLNRETSRSFCTTHGKSKTREYRCWAGMLARCTNPNSSSAPRYIGRGITVCERWKNSFAAFVEDMGESPTSDYSIDRIDNNSGYCKENCRWATRTEQQRNMRGNKIIEIGGVSRCLVEWAEIAKTNYKTVSLRIKRGWSNEDAIFTPVKKYKY